MVITCVHFLSSFNSFENGRLVIRDLGNNFINHKFSNLWNQVYILKQY